MERAEADFTSSGPDRPGLVAVLGTVRPVSSLRQPVGPQQPGVYWFRRGLLLLVLVLIFVGVGYLLFGRGSGTTPVAAPSASTTPSITPSAIPSITPSITPSSTPTITPSSTPSITPSSTPSNTPSTTPSSTPSSTASTGVRACNNSDISVVATTNKISYPVGATPNLQLRISNTSSTACRRSVGSGANELIVYQGTTRFWSSNDCNPGGGQDTVTISAGQTYSVSFNWPAIASSVNCPANPATATAGAYSLVGINQVERSKPAPFTFTTTG